MQYIQIAESVLSKLPSNLQLPETRTMTHEIRESRISVAEIDNEKNDNESENVEMEKSVDEIDEDLV